MSESQHDTPELPYVCGHDSREIERLTLQSRIYSPVTHRLLVRAGIGAGDRVVDVGCGGGDVSLLAAALVGPGGLIVGVDRSKEALDAARARARASGIGHVHFVRGALDTWAPAEPVDAVIGRFVLMHQRDPIATLRRVRSWLRPHGAVAFVESDTAACVTGAHSAPHSPTYERIVSIWHRALGAAGVHINMGARLVSAFQAAGFHAPSLEVDRYVSGEADSPLFRFAVESARSMLPLAVAAGAPVPSAEELETLEERLRAEVMAASGTLSAPTAYAVWARV